MKFVDNVLEEEYQLFYENYDNAHFLQSIMWGKIVSETRNQSYHLVGVKDNDNNLIAAGLLLRKKTPFNMCYYYSSRGFLIDFNNNELLTVFTNGLKEYLIKTNGIYLKVDPEISYQTINEEGKKIDGPDNYLLFDNLIKLGYKHQGFNKLHEKNQPRYTFRRYFKNYQSISDIDNSMSKTFMKTVRRSYNYDLTINLSSNVDDFVRLNKYNAIKDGFNGYDNHFYETFCKYTVSNGSAKIYNVSINPKHLVKKFEDELNSINDSIKNNTISKKDRGNADLTIERLNKDILKFNSIDSNNLVIVSMICVYAKKGVWTLYIGNDDLGEYTFAVNRVYYEAIIDAFKDNYEFIDLFGTVGDPHTKYKKLGGLHEYKRKFGDEYIEFIGEFDLINKKMWYYTLPILLKIYRLVRKIIKR